VLVENVPAGEIGRSGMETLASWVEETGSGLMLTGGQKSYGPGGYFKSPLDRILPVSMEMRREHRKLSLAIVVALDRSGSMAISAGGGRTKMDLADLGTVQVLDLLSPMDELGVIAVDTSPHIIVPLDSVDRNQGMRGRILSIDSMGGGIYIYEALSAAARMITQARAQTRHIILFADANDSEQPGRYRELVEKCRESGVTVSVVGLGTPADQDADLLKDIATLGGGTCYFTDSAQEIPRLFAQDTFTVARSTFVDEATPFQFTAGFDLLGAALGPPPPLGGYNLCYLRPDANLAAVTTDEYQAPVVSAWSAGAGRVLCFAGEADGKYTGPLAGWSQAGEFFSTLARWTAGRPGELPSGELLTEQVRDGNCLVQLHLDPDRTGDPFPAVPHVRMLHGLPGVPPEKQSLPLQWKSADLLEVSLPISGRETVLNTVEIPGLKPVTLPPVCLPYSPEFAPDQPGRGVAALARLASVSGGKERIEIPQTWAELPVKRRYVELAPWLLVLAVILFLGEILERRTGWLSRVFARPARLAAEEDESVAGPAPARRQPWSRFIPKRAVRKKVVIRPAAITEAKPASEVSSVIPASKPAEGESAASNLEALREARERASRRTSRP
jgi:Mg-chelatase subunit ChlD